MRTHRSTSVRRSSPITLVTALLAGLLSGTVPGSALLAQTASSMQTTASIGLELDAERVDALFAGAGSVSAADLLSEALTLKTRAPGGDIVLIAFRMRDGQTLSEYRSDPFEAAEGLLSPRGILPGADFYGGLAVEQDGISGTMAASPASQGIADPTGFVARSVLGGPSDRFSREVIYAIAVPADPGLQAEATASGVVLYGDEAITLESAGGGGAGRGEPEDAQEVLERFAASEQRCKGGLKDYTVYQRTPEGMVVPLYFNAYQGGPECRAVPITEYMDSLHVHAGMGPQRWPAEMAMGYDLLGQGLEDGLAQEGFPLPVSILTDPLADFSRAASEVEPGELMVDDVEDRVADRNEFYRRAHLVGKQGINGRPAYHVRAEGMDLLLDTTGGTTWSLTGASAWIDAERDVLLRLRFEVVAQGGDANGREIVIESVHLNHRLVPLAPYEMWFPTRHVMRITGLTETMSEEDQAKIEQVRADIEKLRGQMEQMPAAMRGMLEKQIVRLENMSGDGDGPSVTEAVIDILRVAVNEGPPYPGGPGAFDVEGQAFNGMGQATWVPLATTGFYYVPSEISMIGKAGNKTGWIAFKGDPSELGEYDFEEPSVDNLGSIAQYPGTVEGGYRLENGDEVQVAPEPGLMLIYTITPTEVRGKFGTRGTSGEFVMGHMPCSDESRAIGMKGLVPMDVEQSKNQSQDELDEIFQDPETMKRCWVLDFDTGEKQVGGPPP